MHKKNPRYKEWQKRRLAKIARRKSKKNPKKTSARASMQNKRSSPAKLSEIRTSMAKAPSNFCIRENYAETVKFFSSLLNYMHSCDECTNILVDLSSVEQISVDAIIYLLAIIKDKQKLSKTKHNFIGYLPENEECRQFFIQSGFLNYVNSRCKKVDTPSNMIQIETSNVYDQTFTQKICDFVCQKSNYTIKNTKFLYVLINEMMLNTIQHAYLDGTTNGSWYLFVQCDTTIKFTFLDTGLGIPKTALKKWNEKLFNKSDSGIITSALNGELRTQTGSKYRGKGLPKIKECVDNNLLNNINIISNKAICSINYDHNNNCSVINSIDLQHSLPGTIYYWELNLEGAKL